MSTTYRIGPANVLVASALTDPVSSWRDFGLTRGNAVLDLNARDLALLRADQEKTPLADAAYITPSPNSVRFLLTDYQLSNLLDVFPGSVQLTASAKTALATAGLPHSTAKLSPKSWAIVPSREYSDDLFFLDSPSVVWFEYAFARVDAIVAGNAIEDTDDALSSTAYEITLTRVIPNSSGIGNPLLSGKGVQGVLFAWQPSIDALTPLIGQGAGTFTRATTATYIDANGTIQSVASGQPRYQDGGLLLEPQRTNYFLRSDPTAVEGPQAGISYVARSWSCGQMIYATNFDETVPAVSDYRYGATIPSSTVVTLSAYIEMYDGSAPAPGPAGASRDFQFVISGTPLTSGYTVEHVVGSVYRVWTTATSGVSTLGNNGIIRYSGHSSKGFYASGFQIEPGSYPTSYIPTSGSTVTRNVDVLSFGITHNYSDSEGVTIYDKRTPYTTATNPSGWVTGVKMEGASLSKNTLGVASYNGNVRALTGFNAGGTASTPSPATAYADGVEIESTLSYGPANALKYFNGDTVGIDDTAPTTGELLDGYPMGPISIQHGAQVVSAVLVTKAALTPAQLRRILR